MSVRGECNGGIEGGIFLTQFGTKITVLEVREQIGASQILQKKAASSPKMDVMLQTAVQEFKWNGHLECVVVKDLKTGEL